MRQLSKSLDKNSAGQITLLPECAEDMWHVYNLIAIGDQVHAKGDRKVNNESNTGSVSTQRMIISLTIKVESIDYDAHAAIIYVKGRNMTENQHIKMGAYHTLDLQLNRKFSIYKYLWDSVSVQRISDACDPVQNAELAAVVMDVGLAHLCLITSVMTIVRAKVETNIPRKRKGFNDNHKNAMEKFFKQVADGIRRHFNFEIAKCILLASPGFIKEEFFTFLMAYAKRESEAGDGRDTKSARAILDNKGKFILSHSASGHKAALTEVLMQPTVQSRISETKAFREVKLLDDLQKGINEDPHTSRATYGAKNVEYAAESEAIDTLLVTDTLFRSRDIAERKRFVRLVDRVSESKGEVVIFSSLHVTGQHLDRMTGVGALLRFPLPDLDEYNDEEDESSHGDYFGHNGCNGQAAAVVP